MVFGGKAVQVQCAVDVFFRVRQAIRQTAESKRLGVVRGARKGVEWTKGGIYK